MGDLFGTLTLPFWTILDLMLDMPLRAAMIVSALAVGLMILLVGH